MNETVKQTIKRDGCVVTLVTDGRSLSKAFNNETDAHQFYLVYKAKIEAATVRI